jgi:hypothetical protein
MNLTEIDIIKPRFLDRLVANNPAELTMVYRISRSDSKLKPYNYLARFILTIGIGAIAAYLLQYVGTSREIICEPRTLNVVTCQHHSRDFLWLRLTEHLPFQLQSAEVTPYQASRSDGESREYYTAYQLDIFDVQTNGQSQYYMTMRSYDENQDRAYADLGKNLDLRSGASREPLILGDTNASNLFPFLFLCGWVTRRLGLWRYLVRPDRRVQQPAGQAMQSDEPIRCRPATTWTETAVEYGPNPSVQPVNRRINSLYSPSNSPSNKLN